MDKKRTFLILISLVMGIHLFPQSRIPEADQDYLNAISRIALGGRDRINVVFFEVPDTIASTLYFAIRDPEGNNNSPDVSDGTLHTYYTLLGGPGVLSNPNSRLSTYGQPLTTDPYIGSILSQYEYDNTFTAITGPDVTADNQWVFFPGVSPSQGEHIGNKYYFKIIAEGQYEATTPSLKNAYQLDISLSNTPGSTPSGIAGVRAFAYSWMVCFRDDTAHDWHIWPFVPDDATGSIVYHNYDMDDNENATAYRINGSAPVPEGTGLTESSDNIEATDSKTIEATSGIGRNGAWELRVRETSGGTPNNTTELWFTNSVSAETYRAYSSSYIPPVADHVDLSYTDGVALNNGTDTETVVLQIVDANGDPAPYVRQIYVTVNNSGLIRETNTQTGLSVTNVLVTTNSTGMGYIKVSDGTAEIVTVTPYTDGTGTSDVFGAGTDDTIQITFTANPDPVMSSAGNLSFYDNKAAPINLTMITITEVGATSITNTADSLILRIPSGLIVDFDTTGLNPTFGGTGPGATIVSRLADELIMTPSGNFTAGQTLTISGLRFNDTTDVSSTGRLELSFNGGGSFSVIDDKVITVIDSTAADIWDGSAGTDWATDANWVDGTAPASGNNIIIPYVTTDMPVLTAPVTVKNLTIGNGASLTLGSNNLTINGIISNDGTLILNGVTGQSVTYAATNDTDSGIVRYVGSVSATGLAAGYNYYNLEFASAGTPTWTAANALTISGSLTINAGNILNIVSYNLTVTGTFTNNGTLSLTGNSGQTLSYTNDTNSGLVRYTGATPPAPGLAAGYSYFNVEFTGSGTFAIPAAMVLNVAGYLTVSAGRLDASSGADISAAGDVTFSGTGTFSKTTDTYITFTGSATKNLYGNGQDLGNITLDGTAGNIVIIQQNVTTDNLLINPIAEVHLGSTAAVTLTINAGKSIANNGVFLIIGTTNLAAITSTAGNTFAFSGTDIDYGGLIVHLGRLGSYGDDAELGVNEGIVVDTTSNFDYTIALNDASSVFTIAASQTVTTSDDAVMVNAGTLTIDTGSTLDTGTGSVSNSGTISSAGAISCGLFTSSGTFTNTAANTITASGDAAISGTFSTPINNTLAMTGDAATLNVNAAVTIGNFIANISGTGTISLASNMSLAGNLTVSSAATTLDLLNYDVTAVVNIDCNGTIDASGGGDITVSGSADFTGGSYSAGSGTLIFSNTASQNLTSDAINLGNVQLSTINTMLVLQDTLTCVTMTIDADTILAVDDNSLTCTTALNNNGTLTRFGTGESVPYDNNSGTVVYNGSGGSIQQYAGFTDYNILQIAGTGAGIYSLSDDTQVANDIVIAAGEFRLLTFILTVGRDFTHSGGTFTCGTGTVDFINVAQSIVTGNNTFYNFFCTVPAKTILFGTDQTQSITASGRFKIKGTPGNNIILNYSFTGTGTHWSINASNEANIEIEYVTVNYSDATPQPIIVPPYVDTFNCINWLFTINVANSWTEDTDSNGKIDRIRVQVQGGIVLNDDFSVITISIRGVIISEPDIYTGSGTFDDVFYFNIDEAPVLDTDARPEWEIDANSSLLDNLTKTKLVDTPTIQTPLDTAPPIIGYTLASADKNEVFMVFSEDVESSLGGPITAGNFTGYAGNPVTGINRITFSMDGTSEVLLTMSTAVSANDIYNQEIITTTNIQDGADPAPFALVSATHRITDVGLGLAGNGVVEPLWARDQTERAPDLGGVGYIDLFNNTKWLRDQNITLQAHIHDDIAGSALTVNLLFDVNVPDNLQRSDFWLPPYASTDYNGLVPYQNPAARTAAIADSDAQLRTYTIPAGDSEIKDNAVVEFLFQIADSDLYCGRLANPSAADWYRNVRCWAFAIHDIIKQESNVTILNNVINPARGEEAYLHYILKKAGSVTITVFDLKGDIVDILYTGRRNKGDYSTAWDGRNRGGRIVARGIYFIKIVAPDIDEIRKVLVVK